MTTKSCRGAIRGGRPPQAFWHPFKRQDDLRHPWGEDAGGKRAPMGRRLPWGEDAHGARMPAGEKAPMGKDACRKKMSMGRMH
jgi:hypothetical protein